MAMCEDVRECWTMSLVEMLPHLKIMKKGNISRKIFNDFFLLRIADDFSCFLIKMFSLRKVVVYY